MQGINNLHNISFILSQLNNTKLQTSNTDVLLYYRILSDESINRLY